MTAQHPRMSMIESVSQSVVGVVIGYGVVLGIESLRLEPRYSAALITAVMFFVSTLRGYFVRRGFERRRAP